MTRLSLLLALGLSAALPVQAQSLPGATDITAAEVRDFLARLPQGESSDLPIRVVDMGGYQVGVYGVSRPASAPDRATVHETDMAEIYYILEGSGTLVTGGTLREPTERTASVLFNNMDNVRSNAGIDGGVSRRAGPGDMIIIPGGVPHWWSARDGDMTYLIIRPDPSNVIRVTQ